ncbi:MAG: hypothetical protein PVG24_05485 [Gammaproteobacteria bacterium]
MSANAVGQPRTRRTSLVSVILFLSAGSLVVSESHAAAKGTWADGASRDQSFTRVLVVGLSPDRNQRCRFERELAAVIKSDDTAAIVSCDAIPAQAPLTRESIEAAVAEKDADAVLTTSLVSKSWEVNDKGTRDTRGDAFYKATDAYYGLYGNVVAADFRTTAPITNVKGNAQVTSELYETREATVVYTIETKARNFQSTGEGVADVTGQIGKRLRRDGLVR